MLLIMEKYCNELFKLCYFYLRNIGCIRNYIIEEVCKMFVNVFVIFCLDYGNVLFVGINIIVRFIILLNFGMFYVV